MINRILVALFFIPLLIWIYLKGDLTFLLFTNVIVGVGLYEFYRMMKQANKANAKFTIILGEDELQANSVVLKNMNESTQETISIDELLNKLTTLTK